MTEKRDKVFIATKFGFRLHHHASSVFSDGGSYVDGSPEYIREAVEKSLKRLKIETIDLYYAHRIDPNIPVEETVEAMAKLVKEGKVRYLGLSEYSLVTRGVEAEILPLTKELGVTLVPFSPLGRGLVTNTIDVNTLDENDYRKHLPRYIGEHWDNNRKLSGEFTEIATNKNVSPAQLALAWLLTQSSTIIPIPGTKRIKYLEDNAKSVDVDMSVEDLATIERLLKKYPNVGDRYNQHDFSFVDK